MSNPYNNLPWKVVATARNIKVVDSRGKAILSSNWAMFKHLLSDDFDILVSMVGNMVRAGNEKNKSFKKAAGL